MDGLEEITALPEIPVKQPVLQEALLKESNEENTPKKVKLDKGIPPVSPTDQGVHASAIQKEPIPERDDFILTKENSKLLSILQPEAIDANDSDQDVLRVTANLWKYIPIPEQQPEPFPEYRIQYQTYEQATIIGARVRGKKHKHEGTNCDDWFETAASGKVTYIAVADGAGSKKYSRIGAKSACQAAVGYLKEVFDDTILPDKALMQNLSLQLEDENCIAACKTLAGVVQDAFLKAYAAVESAFYQRSFSKIYSDCLGRALCLKDFSSTFLLAVVVPLENKANEKLFISCQIGDGMIALIDTNAPFAQSVKLMAQSDHGAFSGETDFLVNQNLLTPTALAARTKLSRGNSDLLLLMTDGVADDYFPNEMQMQRLYLDLLANGILEPENMISMKDLSVQQLEMIKKLPEPETYPWINDRTVTVALQNANRISKQLGISIEALWNQPFLASIASISVRENGNKSNPAELLKVWLDNYTERGSFDDRTLVITKI